MVLDVDPPTPPDLTNRGVPNGAKTAEVMTSESDLRRAELEALLEDGAWTEAFHEWAEYTDLTEADFREIDSEGLFDELDFYWDPVEEALAFDIPDLPDAWTGRTVFASLVRTELTDLGHAVVEMLEDAYVEWGETEPADGVWSEEALGEEPPQRD
ncbi:hypothetical protein [Halorarius litoreus]|uniref:hypothetical protein n=1 Tax=Halorarius litoreus TaxID=2962676 RepID=UPI0020CF1EB5|nr:hypothetical protein [Halorarius litoreus]